MLGSVFISFNGNCQEALEFYADAFNVQPATIMKFKDVPDFDPEKLPDEYHDRIMYSEIRCKNVAFMMSDVIDENQYISSSNISLSVAFDSEEETHAVWDKLILDSQQIIMPMGPTFFAPNYGLVIDKFGISWMVTQDHDNSIKSE